MGRISITPGTTWTTCTICASGPSLTPPAPKTTCGDCRKCTCLTTRCCTCMVMHFGRECSSWFSYSSSRLVSGNRWWRSTTMIPTMLTGETRPVTCEEAGSSPLWNRHTTAFFNTSRLSREVCRVFMHLQQPPSPPGKSTISFWYQLLSKLNPTNK